MRIFVTQESHRQRAIAAVAAEAVPFSVIVKKGGTRSLQQNAYLWGVCYATILEQGGETLAGWTATDLHEYFLIEHFGHEVLEGFGRKRLKPLHRSSVLTKMEFVDFVAFIQQKAAEMGIVIPDPEGTSDE